MGFFPPCQQSALLLVSIPSLSCTPQPSECAGAVADLMPVYAEASLSYSPQPALDTEQVPGDSPRLEFSEWSDLLHCHIRTLLCNATGGWGTSFVKSCSNILKFFIKSYRKQKVRICRLSLYNMIIFLSECNEYLLIPHLVFMAKNNTSKPANKYAWKTGIGFHSVSVLICFPTLLKHLLRLVEEYVHMSINLSKTYIVNWALVTDSICCKNNPWSFCLFGVLLGFLTSEIRSVLSLELRNVVIKKHSNRIKENYAS